MGKWTMDDCASNIEWQDAETNLWHVGKLIPYGHPFGAKTLLVLPLYPPSLSRMKTIFQVESEARNLKVISVYENWKRVQI